MVEVRITHEADYAIRMTALLAMRGEKLGARQIAEESGVTQRFTLKILRRLMMEGVITSFKGIKGGYALAKDPSELSIGQIIEIIDGPIAINHCLNDEFSCTRVDDKADCSIHKVFCIVNKKIRDELYATKLGSVLEKECGHQDK